MENILKSQISESLKQLYVLLQILKLLLIKYKNTEQSFFLYKVFTKTNPCLLNKGCTYKKLEVSNNLLDKYQS